MKALDTNVLVRFLVQDDRQQAETVRQHLEEAESGQEVFYISLLVVMELIWVLESVYEVSRKDLLDSLSALLSMPIMRFEKQELLRTFIQAASANTFDLSDLLIGLAARNADCSGTLTFDKKAAKSPYFEWMG